MLMILVGLGAGLVVSLIIAINEWDFSWLGLGIIGGLVFGLCFSLIFGSEIDAAIYPVESESTKYSLVEYMPADNHDNVYVYLSDYPHTHYSIFYKDENNSIYSKDLNSNVDFIYNKNIAPTLEIEKTYRKRRWGISSTDEYFYIITIPSKDFIYKADTLKE